MAALSSWLHGLTWTAGIAGLLFTSTVAAVALVSVTARAPGRRRDARATLRILLPRRGPDKR